MTEYFPYKMEITPVASTQKMFFGTAKKEDSVGGGSSSMFGKITGGAEDVSASTVGGTTAAGASPTEIKRPVNLLKSTANTKDDSCFALGPNE